MCLDAIEGAKIETLNCAGYDHGWVRVYTYEDDAAPLLPKGTILRITGDGALTTHEDVTFEVGS